jgi:hypothetical protein
MTSRTLCAARVAKRGKQPSSADDAGDVSTQAGQSGGCCASRPQKGHRRTGPSRDKVFWEHDVSGDGPVDDVPMARVGQVTENGTTSPEQSSQQPSRRPESEQTENGEGLLATQDHGKKPGPEPQVLQPVGLRKGLPPRKQASGTDSPWSPWLTAADVLLQKQLDQQNLTEWAAYGEDDEAEFIPTYEIQSMVKRASECMRSGAYAYLAICSGHLFWPAGRADTC